MPTQALQSAASRLVRASILLLGLLGTSAAAVAQELVLASGRQVLSLPVFVADAQGYFAAEGLRVRILDCAFGRVCLRHMLDGKAHLATVADSPVMFASFETDRFAIIATLNTTRNDIKLVTRKSTGVRQVSDLAGKPVGTFLGTSAHYYLDALALLSGLDPSRLQLVNLTPDSAAGALAAGTVDAVALFEPYAFATVRSLGDDALLLTGRRVYTQTWNLVASRDIVGVRDRDIEALLRALLRAEQFIQREPERAKALLRERAGVDDALIAWTWPDQSWSLTLEQSLLTTLEGQARWALRSGRVKAAQAPNYLEFIHAGPLQRVKPTAVSLSR